MRGIEILASLPETDSSTMNLSMSSGDLSEENKVLNLVDQISPLMRPLQILF